jgi:Zn-dependent protease with chaperone function
VVKNQQIEQLIFTRTGLKITTLKIAESDYLFGMMIGIPGRPQLLLSRKLYRTFTPEEIEYVILHEAGHYQLGHALAEFLAFIFLFTIDILLLNRFSPSSFSIPLALSLGLVSGILMIRLGRTHECAADRFAVRRMTDPRGMVRATEKFRSFSGIKFTENKNPILHFLFYRGNPYANRINMAEEELKRRQG